MRGLSQTMVSGVDTVMSRKQVSLYSASSTILLLSIMGV